MVLLYRSLLKETLSCFQKTLFPIFEKTTKAVEGRDYRFTNF